MMEQHQRANPGGSTVLSIEESKDLSHYLDQQPGGWEVQANQLKRTAFSSRIRILRLPGLFVYQNVWGGTCVVQGQSPEGWLMLGGIVNPDKAPVSWCGASADRRHFACAAAGQEVDFWVKNGCSSIVVLLAPSLLNQTVGEAACDAITQSRRLDFGDAGGALINLAISTLNKFESGPRSLRQPTVLAQVHSTLLRALEDCFSGFESLRELESSCSRADLVHRAVQHVANSDDTVSALAMAQAVGVSQKTLELAFREVMNTTPGRYLMLTRLNNAHHALAFADKTNTTVTDVAMGLGFTHMGRFSKVYWELFGELPSDTLRRSG